MYTLILSVFYLYSIQVNTYVRSLLSYDTKIRVFLKKMIIRVTKTLNFGKSGLFKGTFPCIKKPHFLVAILLCKCQGLYLYRMTV